MSSTLTRDITITGVPNADVPKVKSGLERQGYVVSVKPNNGTSTVTGILKSQGK
jgi:hypothetical protein